MVKRRDYTAEAVAAARSVLIELVHLLGEYREHTVLIGGWVPELLLSGSTTLHVGSMDIDLAIDHRRIEEAGYKMIRELLPGRSQDALVDFRPRPYAYGGSYDRAQRGRLRQDHGSHRKGHPQEPL